MKFVDETSDVTSLKITLEGKNVRVLFQKKKKKSNNKNTHVQKSIHNLIK